MDRKEANVGWLMKGTICVKCNIHNCSESVHLGMSIKRKLKVCKLCISLHNEVDI